MYGLYSFLIDLALNRIQFGARSKLIVDCIIVFSKTETTIRRTAVKETGVSRYHEVPIEGPPEIP